MPILESIIAGGFVVLSGFMLYKAMPTTIAYVVDMRNYHLYKTLVVPFGQNRTKVINMIKFISTCKNESSVRSTCISVEGEEYVIPIDAFYIKYHGIKIYLKVALDQAGNVASVVTSIYKRKMVLGIDDASVSEFNCFVGQFNSKSVEKTISAASIL
jgi:hypothetical protein